eukprot:SAG31_NODE_19702_length_594_cov_0.802020_1_plen_95_part_10
MAADRLSDAPSIELVRNLIESIRDEEVRDSSVEQFVTPAAAVIEARESRAAQLKVAQRSARLDALEEQLRNLMSKQGSQPRPPSQSHDLIEPVEP